MLSGESKLRSGFKRACFSMPHVVQACQILAHRFRRIDQLRVVGKWQRKEGCCSQTVASSLGWPEDDRLFMHVEEFQGSSVAIWTPLMIVSARMSVLSSRYRPRRHGAPVTLV
jgi:hypothetical protein